MHFTQINLHKAKLAAIELHNNLRNRQDIVLITEPYIYKGKYVGLPRGYAVFFSEVDAEDAGESGVCRAAILVPKHVQAVQIDKVSNADAAVVQIVTARGKLTLASVYLDIKKVAVPAWLGGIPEYAEASASRILMGIDTNAHSQLYGPSTNTRGEEIEEFILNHGFMVENQGTVPTYEVIRRNNHIQTHIDVTLTREISVYKAGRYLGSIMRQTITQTTGSWTRRSRIPPR